MQVSNDSLPDKHPLSESTVVISIEGLLWSFWPILAHGKTEISLSVSTQFDFYQHQSGEHVES